MALGIFAESCRILPCSPRVLYLCWSGSADAAHRHGCSAACGILVHPAGIKPSSLHCKVLNHWTSLEVLYLVAQSCLILGNPMDCTPPGSSVHRILQARILEWVAIHSSRGSFRPKGRTLVSRIIDGFFTV